MKKQNEMEKDKITILKDIGKIITESARPHRTLEKIVELVAGKFNIDVCMEDSREIASYLDKLLPLA